MPVFSKLIDYYELGSLQGKPITLDGGRSHKLWRIDTTKGRFVVKQMLPRFEKAINVDLYRNTQAIAKVIAQHNIPAIAAIVNRDRDVCYFDGDDVYMVFPYVAALRLARSKMTVKQCEAGGACLAHIHSLALDVPCASEWQFSFSSAWSDYIKNLEQLQPQLAGQIRSILSLIENCYRVAADYRASAPQALVVSHRDLDTYNFIWDAQGKFFIVDWDAAGHIDAATELMYVAITWGMERHDHLNMDKVAAIFSAYEAHQLLRMGNRLALLDTVLTNWMNWVFKQLKRLATQSLNLAEKNVAIGEIRNSVLSFMHVQSRKKDPWFCQK